MAEGVRREYKTESLKAYTGGSTLVSREMMESLVAEIKSVPIPWYLATSALQRFVDEWTDLQNQLEERRRANE